MSADSAPHRCPAALATLWRQPSPAEGGGGGLPRRRPDRARGRLVLVLVLASVGAPAVAAAVGPPTAQYGRGTEPQTARHLHPVVTTTDGAALPGGAAMTADATRVHPLSDRHREPSAVSNDVRVGGTVAVWVNELGRPAAAPRPGTDTVADAAASIGLMTLAGLSLGAASRSTLRRRTLDHRAGESR
ncbi:hypothetical protein [Kitasatospora sp. HPMI-4]|uniref:hypothetical protein n=1 Tax=Kitasatospora sp. HPMI-4 TaxID=3448443 RepID=UPI003F19D6DF